MRIVLLSLLILSFSGCVNSENAPISNSSMIQVWDSTLSSYLISFDNGQTGFLNSTGQLRDNELVISHSMILFSHEYETLRGQVEHDWSQIINLVNGETIEVRTDGVAFPQLIDRYVPNVHRLAEYDYRPIASDPTTLLMYNIPTIHWLGTESVYGTASTPEDNLDFTSEFVCEVFCGRQGNTVPPTSSITIDGRFESFPQSWTIASTGNGANSVNFELISFSGDSASLIEFVTAEPLPERGDLQRCGELICEGNWPDEWSLQRGVEALAIDAKYYEMQVAYADAEFWGATVFHDDSPYGGQQIDWLIQYQSTSGDEFWFTPRVNEAYGNELPGHGPVSAYAGPTRTDVSVYPAPVNYEALTLQESFDSIGNEWTADDLEVVQFQYVDGEMMPSWQVASLVRFQFMDYVHFVFAPTGELSLSMPLL
jgi:hypothetical protein